MKSSIQPTAPVLKRLYAYSRERFPLLGHGVLIVSYYSSNQFLAKALMRPGEPVAYSFHSVLGALVLFCMFLHLRVFDEHKDFEDDCRFHPDRLLQRGVITLRELRRLGLAAIAFELLVSAWIGTAAFVAALIVLAFSLLMLKEFFVRAWMRRHFLVYAVSHMLIMPLFALFVFSVATGMPPWTAPGWYWLYAFVGFFVTFNWEISRKIRAPEQEVEGLDSYSKLFGTYGAAYAVLGVRVIDTLLVALVGWHLGLSVWFYAILVLLFFVCLIGFLQFRFSTNARTAKRMETYAGIYIIAFDLTLAVEIVRKLGITWEAIP
jgi:4-hydroxybenzoate polyprenyltransferase